MANSPSKTELVVEYNRQAERLGQFAPSQEDESTGSTRAIEAKFVTPQDPVIHTANNGRLPVVPLKEAVKLNALKDELEGQPLSRNIPLECDTRAARDGSIHGAQPSDHTPTDHTTKPDASLSRSLPERTTNPLFPPLPLYGPPSLLRSLQCWLFRSLSAVLSFTFLVAVLAGAIVTSIPLALEHVRLRLAFKDPHGKRPFHHEEVKRDRARKQREADWLRNKGPTADISSAEYVPTEGGPDPLVSDPVYYARREGLDADVLDVETEDGFIITIIHLYNPLARARRAAEKKRQYPVLMIHGLFQSAGAYCCTEDHSLAFYLAKSGYDVWLGNNRCGFDPRHTLLKYGDPRMWAWNIRQMGVMDLTALTDRVIQETSFARIGLVAHSQGTTQTFVALAKEQRPELGDKLSVFCALAPAVYAGPLLSKAYLKFMRIISPRVFKCVFGIHSFIPFMNVMHRQLNRRIYGAIGYRVFSFLFCWTDTRWELALRDRLFQFSPTYASAESMRWWLGRDCFAKQKCILATRQEAELEDIQDGLVNKDPSDATINANADPVPTTDGDADIDDDQQPRAHHAHYAWYDSHFPPLAMWVAGADGLVDGRRLLRRFERGREPCVQVVHEKIIEGYEHLDVIWAMDSIEQIGTEVKEVIWRTAGEEVRGSCEVPRGCEGVEGIMDARFSSGPGPG